MESLILLIIIFGIPICGILLIYVLIKKLIKYHAEVSGKRDEENRKFREGTTVGRGDKP